jgi:hypothetical protein
MGCRRSPLTDRDDMGQTIGATGHPEKMVFFQKQAIYAII